MKKLLSLLSVLTISGTAAPITIAASPYQKEEKLNSEISYSQTNNLEILNRSKREIEECNLSSVNFNSLQENDGSTFAVKYKALWHDNIYAKFSNSFAMYASCQFVISGTKEQYLYNVSLMFEKAKQIDEMGAGGSIGYDDYRTVASVIWDNITFFNQQLQKNQYELSGHYGQKIEVHTDRIGTFDKLNPENNIYFVY